MGNQVEVGAGAVVVGGEVKDRGLNEGAGLSDVVVDAGGLVEGTGWGIGMST